MAVARPKRLDGVLVERELARRQQTNLIELVGRALRIGVKGPNGIDLVVEQVEPVGRVGAHRVEIHHRAANRVLAVRSHFRNRGIAGRFQALAQGVEIQRIAGLEHHRARVDEGGRRQRLEQRVGGDDENAAAHAGQGMQQRQPFRDDVRMRREHVVGQRFPVREVAYREIGRGEEAQFFLEPVGAVFVGDHGNRQPGVVLRRTRERERCSTAMQAVPAVVGAGAQWRRRERAHGRGFFGETGHRKGADYCTTAGPQRARRLRWKTAF